MIPKRSQPSKSKFPTRKTVRSQIELQEQIKETLREMYDLLEEHAPAWYPQRLHEKANSVLQLLEK